MQQFMRFLIEATNNSSVGGWIFILMFTVAIFALVIAAYLLIFGIYNPNRSRLNSISNTQKKNTFFRNSTTSLGNYFVIRERAGEKLNVDRKRLFQAGYFTKNSISTYYGIKILTTLSFPILLFVIILFFFPNVSSNQILISTLSVMVVGYISPSFVLDKKITKRRLIIKNSFPDVLDKLIVCSEAGLGLDAALQRVTNDTLFGNEIMGYELNMVNAEMRSGVDRDQALKNLVTRTGVDEIKGLTTALAQSMRFGTSIGTTLRIYSDDLRDKRMQSAEEAAAKLAVKMLIPLLLCFFPVIFIVILGGAVISSMSLFN